MKKGTFFSSRLYVLAVAAAFALFAASFPSHIFAQSTSPDLVQRVINRINHHRLQHGCAALVPHELLMLTAQRHAEEMARLDYFGHNSADGNSVLQRITAAGYHYLWAGENIMSWQSSPEQVVDRWYDESPPNDPHRRNLLKCTYRDIGVGYYFMENDTGVVTSRRYWVADFAQPVTNPIATVLPVTQPSTPTLAFGTQTPVPTRVVQPTRISPSPTRRLSPIPTGTLAQSACNTIPARPVLTTPAANSRLPNSIVWLDWSNSACATRYVLILKESGKPASLILRNRALPISEFTTPQLTPGLSYYWRVRACNQLGCSPRTERRALGISPRVTPTPHP